MGGFLLRKVGAALVVIVLASMLVFLGVRALPGDPALALGGEQRDPEVLAQIRHDYGLDQPLPVQYVHWMGHVLRGDLGTDQRKLSVSHTIVTKLPITLELAGLAIVFGSALGILAGVIAAVRRGKASDYAATTVALAGLSVPHFWLGLLMIVLFAVDLHWLPAGGYVPFAQDPLGNLEHMVMPAIVLGAGLSAVVMRQMRSAMLDSLNADYVRTARAKGLSERSVVGKHALRNSLITVTTIIGLQLGALISGAVITEQIFGWNGIGQLAVRAAGARDPSLMMGIILITGSAVLLANIIADVAYAYVDPRVRYEQAKA